MRKQIRSRKLSVRIPVLFSVIYDFLKKRLEQYLKNGYEVSIFAETETQADRIEQLLKDYPVKLYAAHISQGFVLPDIKHIVVQENEIFGRRKRIPASVKKTRG